MMGAERPTYLSGTPLRSGGAGDPIDLGHDALRLGRDSIAEVWATLPAHVDTFDASHRTGETRLLLDHPAAQAYIAASVLWVDKPQVAIITVLGID